MQGAGAALEHVQLGLEAPDLDQQPLAAAVVSTALAPASSPCSVQPAPGPPSCLLSRAGGLVAGRRGAAPRLL
eukprot:3114655-Pyramimonas_sp.AAC.1